MVDMDPQASLTQATVGVQEGRSLAEVLGKGARLTMGDILRKVAPGLAIAPSDLVLSYTETQLMTSARPLALRTALQPITGAFDVCLVDCPPSLGALTINALSAAHGVIVPTLPGQLDFRGVRMFLENLQDLTEANPTLQLLGVLLVQYSPRGKLDQAAVAALEFNRRADPGHRAAIGGSAQDCRRWEGDHNRRPG